MANYLWLTSAIVFFSLAWFCSDLFFFVNSTEPIDIINNSSDDSNNNSNNNGDDKKLFVSDNDRKQSIRIAAGSCVYQRKIDQPLWNIMESYQPDIYFFLGDNIYLDQKLENVKDPETTLYSAFNYEWIEVDWYQNPEKEYQYLLNHKDFNIHKNNIPKLLITDDHDLGKDNTNYYNNPHRFALKKEALKYWKTLNSNVTDIKIDNIINHLLSNKNDKNGIFWYYDYIKILNFSNKELRIRIYGMDSRFYAQQYNNSQLGNVQKKYFEDLFYHTYHNNNNNNKDDNIDFHIFLCGITIFAKFYFEIPGPIKWPEMDIEWFINLLNKYNITKKSLILTGDIHYSIINKNFDLFEIVTSSLTHSISDTVASFATMLTHDNYAMSNIISENNFIILDIDRNQWTVNYINESNHTVLKATYNFMHDIFKIY